MTAVTYPLVSGIGLRASQVDFLAHSAAGLNDPSYCWEYWSDEEVCPVPSFRPYRRICLMLICLLAVFTSSAQELHSYALVQDDGSLKIKGRTVHLYGIYLPPTEHQCQTRIRPVRCAQRAALALEFRIQGFLHCYPKTANADGSLNAVCYADRNSFDEGEDLAAYLIRRGWALALPDAPFEYQALEKIARQRQAGVWGFSADVIQRR